MITLFGGGIHPSSNEHGTSEYLHKVVWFVELVDTKLFVCLFASTTPTRQGTLSAHTVTHHPSSQGERARVTEEGGVGPGGIEVIITTKGSLTSQGERECV